MKAKVDQDTCTGCELCAETCPGVFEMSEENSAVVVTETVPPHLEETCRESAKECPVEAITIE